MTETRDIKTPPKSLGLLTVPAELVLKLTCDHCHASFHRMYREAYVPIGPYMRRLRLPEMPGEDRLANLQGRGIDIPDMVEMSTYDYAKQIVVVAFVPLVVHHEFTEESVALLIALLKDAGWKETAPGWVDRWNEHREPGPNCPCLGHTHGPGGLAGMISQMVGHAVESMADLEQENEEEENAEPPKKKKKKKKDRRNRKD